MPRPIRPPFNPAANSQPTAACLFVNGSAGGFLAERSVGRRRARGRLFRQFRRVPRRPQASLDLSKYAGKSKVRIAFSLQADYSVTDWGVGLDDISVTAQ